MWLSEVYLTAIITFMFSPLSSSFVIFIFHSPLFLSLYHSFSVCCYQVTHTIVPEQKFYELNSWTFFFMLTQSSCWTSSFQQFLNLLFFLGKLRRKRITYLHFHLLNIFRLFTFRNSTVRLSISISFCFVKNVFKFATFVN